MNNTNYETNRELFAGINGEINRDAIEFYMKKGHQERSDFIYQAFMSTNTSIVNTINRLKKSLSTVLHLRKAESSHCDCKI